MNSNYSTGINFRELTNFRQNRKCLTSQKTSSDSRKIKKDPSSFYRIF